MLLWLCCTVAIAIALLWFVYPPLYFDGLNGLVDSYIRFTNYPLNIEERFFGWTYLSTNLPWYYSLLWIPLITDPLALFAAAIGLICLPCKQSQFGSSFRWLNVDWNLTRWLLLITSLSWLAVLILQPTLYDGERQLLWLYSLTLILALLGLHGLKERTKVCLSLILLISCSISYIQWHPYGYLYRSPLLLTTVDMFTGDYWRVCISEGLLKIPSQIAQGSTVVVDNSAQIEWMQRERLEKSILYTDSFLYKTVADIPNDTPFALLTFRSKRSRYWKKAEAYLKENKAQLVWRQALPTGEPICRLIWVKM